MEHGGMIAGEEGRREDGREVDAQIMQGFIKGEERRKENDR